MDRIVAAAHRMQALIQDLLAYSRVDSKSAPFEAIDLNDIHDDVVKLLQTEVEEAKGQITRDELPTVFGDRAQLFQLLQNLIGNGLKYRGERTPHVHVSALKNDNGWTITIRDNGIGIAARHHDRIFEIFQRLHTQEKYAGTGSDWPCVAAS